MPKGSPKPCAHNPERLCADCKKERNRNRMRKLYQADPEGYRAKQRAHYASDIENQRAKTRDWRKRFPERAREIDSPTGLRFGDKTIAAMLEAQQGLCGICPESLVNGFHTDHDHDKPGVPNVRELLCNRCNPGLGCFKHTPSLLREGAEYIERHRGWSDEDGLVINFP